MKIRKKKEKKHLFFSQSFPGFFFLFWGVRKKKSRLLVKKTSKNKTKRQPETILSTQPVELYCQGYAFVAQNHGYFRSIGQLFFFFRFSLYGGRRPTLQAANEREKREKGT